ncbi:MAG: hypothetical protein HY040_02155 [Planctomycetes bacterium]|nr:hypothetical protein [Planctomycetota bacterium]
MTRTTRLAAVCFLIAASCVAGGCDGARSYRAVMRDQIAAMGETEEILAGIKDQATMEAARDRLRAHLESFEEIKQRALALPSPSEEISASLGPEAARIEKAIKGVQSQVGRIQAKIPGGEAFLKSLGPGSELLRD